MIKRFALTLLALAFLGPAAAPAFAGELAQPSGPVVLTIAGKIGKTNRPAFDAFEDGILNYHEKRFDKAAAFDRAMLEGLGLHEVTIAYKDWPKPFRFEGPRLKDLLAAVGATGATISMLALDGYAVDVEVSELDRDDWILAIARDGAPLALGQRGPAWAVYARGDGQPPSHDDEARWGWAIFYIEVR